MLVEVVEQRLRLFFGHADEVLHALADVQRFAPGFGVHAHDGMHHRRAHAARPFLFLRRHPLVSRPQRRRVHRREPAGDLRQLGRERLERQILIGKQRVAADVGKVFGQQHGGGRGPRARREVGMPQVALRVTRLGFSVDHHGLTRKHLHRAVLGMAVIRGSRVVVDLAEARAEGAQFGRVDPLTGKTHDAVLEPDLPDLRDRLVVDGRRNVDAGDLRPERIRETPHRQSLLQHGISSRNGRLRTFPPSSAPPFRFSTEPSGRYARNHHIEAFGFNALSATVPARATESQQPRRAPRRPPPDTGRRAASTRQATLCR